MNVVRSKDCGNSPKNGLVEDLAVALATGDVDTVAKLTIDDAQWRIIGVGELRGRDAIVTALPRLVGRENTKLEITHVMSHGKAGAVNGIIERNGGITDFCDVFELANAKGTSVARITSYRIDS
jgi:hypothetical protein